MLKIINPLRFIFFAFVFLIVFSAPSFAILVKTLGTGNWGTAANWTPRAPLDGDDILIEAGHTITLSGLVNLNNVRIAVRGTLNIVLGSLTINAGSTVIVEGSGAIGGFIAAITVGGTTIPILGFPAVPGPSYIDNGGTHPGTPPGYIPLPIELITFNATISGESVQISWATATELNNDFFTIERSTDGLNWSMIGETSGAGNSTSRIDYEYYDANPIPEISYYRLKQTDFDGQFEYFDAVSLRYNPSNLFKVYPNPSAGPLTIITSGELNNARIIMYDVSGKSVDIPVNTNRYQAFLDISGLDKGVYILEMVYPQSRLTQRIIKQ